MVGTGMKRRATSHDRISKAEALLLKHRNPAQVVAELAESEGISRRQARRYVSEALDLIRGDLDGIDRAQMLSLLVDACNRTIAMGIERHQGAVVIGAVRTLNDLLALGADTRQQRNQWN